MYFEFSKTIGFLSVPSNVIACMALLGLVLLVLRRPSGRIVAGVALAAFVAAAFSPLGNMLLTPLEQWFPAFSYPDRQIEGIIILGGSYDTQMQGYISTIVLEEDTHPMAVVADLSRRYPHAKIVFSGGTDPPTRQPTEAAIAKQFFVSCGIAADRISIEEQSRNTKENAQLTAQLIHPAPGSQWLLVTSAYHMPRAFGTFQTAGFNVIAFPVGWRTYGWRDFWRPAASATENLRRVDVAAHEWIGLLAYRLLGYASE
ncbi:MAG TPA: YdcF family protein [Methylocella sp.]|nr:YdcF family protein [Methylocella sp.]